MRVSRNCGCKQSTCTGNTFVWGWGQQLHLQKEQEWVRLEEMFKCRQRRQSQENENTLAFRSKQDFVLPICSYTGREHMDGYGDGFTRRHTDPFRAIQRQSLR